MPLLFPILSGITTAMTIVLTYETAKNAKRKFDKKSARNAKRHTT